MDQNTDRTSVLPVDGALLSRMSIRRVNHLATEDSCSPTYCCVRNCCVRCCSPTLDNYTVKRMLGCRTHVSHIAREHRGQQCSSTHRQQSYSHVLQVLPVCVRTEDASPRPCEKSLNGNNKPRQAATNPTHAAQTTSQFISCVCRLPVQS